jgi:hypothetical protein
LVYPVEITVVITVITVIARYDEKTGKFQRTKEWVLDTDGVPHP